MIVLTHLAMTLSTAEYKCPFHVSTVEGKCLAVAGGLGQTPHSTVGCTDSDLETKGAVRYTYGGHETCCLNLL